MNTDKHMTKDGNRPEKKKKKRRKRREKRGKRAGGFALTRNMVTKTQKSMAVLSRAVDGLGIVLGSLRQMKRQTARHGSSKPLITWRDHPFRHVQRVRSFECFGSSRPGREYVSMLIHRQ